jgi:hypothetical protein
MQQSTFLFPRLRFWRFLFSSTKRVRSTCWTCGQVGMTEDMYYVAGYGHFCNEDEFLDYWANVQI